MRYAILTKEERVALPDGREAYLRQTYLRRHELPEIAVPIVEVAEAHRARWSVVWAEGSAGRRLKGNVAFTFKQGKASLVLISTDGERWDEAYLSVRGSARQTARAAAEALCPLIVRGLIPKPKATIRRNARYNRTLEELDITCEEGR